MDSLQKRERLLEVLKILSTKTDWEDITTVRVLFRPGRMDEILYTLKTEPEITESEFSLRFLSKKNNPRDLI